MKVREIHRNPQKVLEIWKILRNKAETISKSDLVSLAVILGKYAEEVFDGTLVEYETSMFTANLDFMSIPEDIIADDFSADDESIEIINDGNHILNMHVPFSAVRSRYASFHIVIISIKWK